MKSIIDAFVRSPLSQIYITADPIPDLPCVLAMMVISQVTKFTFDKNFGKISKDHFRDALLYTLPGWDSIMGLQFENVVYKNEKLIFKELGVKMSEVVFANPYFQTATKARKGCQIDYLLQTRYNSVYIVEIKFSKNKIGVSVIDEVREKIQRLKLPKNFSYRPVLIHVNGVTQDLIDMRYFSNIIDYSKFLVKH